MEEESSKSKFRIDRAFTLVELLIVVVILGILAAVVIPQFLDASQTSKDSSLMQDLRVIRAAIEQYRLEHNGRLPNIRETGAADNNANNFIARLTGKTDPDGKINASGARGPYIKAWPSNPFANDVSPGALVRLGTGSPGTGAQGWYFNTNTGTFHANTAGHENL